MKVRGDAFENTTPPGEGTLREEILISLFTNQRIEGVQEGGWWAECLEESGENFKENLQKNFQEDLKNTGSPLGSKLWLLEREKLTPETLERASLYTKEALEWVLDEHLASEIHVSATFIPHGILLKVILSSSQNSQHLEFEV